MRLKRGLDDPNNQQQHQQPIPQLHPVELPFRIESTYPVSMEELLQMLENMIMELAHPRPKKKQLELEPIPAYDFDQYLMKFEQIIQGYEDMIFDIVSADGFTMFKALVAKLYLATRGKVNLEQQEDSDDVRIALSQPPAQPQQEQQQQ